MNAGDDRKTLKLANTLIRKYPDSEGFRFPKGVALLGMGRVDEAHRIASVFLEKNPKSVNGCRLKGRAFLAQGKGDSAIHYLDKAERLDSDSYHMFLLGKAYNLAGEFGNARVAFDASIERGSGSAYSAYRERAVSQMGLGDTTAARADFDKAIELAPKDPVNFNARGFHLWAATEQHEKAVSDYDSAIRLNKNYGFAFNNRAWSRYKLGLKEKAQSDLKLSERRRPYNPFLHWNKGKIALREGSDRACAHFARAIELGYADFRSEEAAAVLKENCPEWGKEKNAPPPASKPKPTTEPFDSNAPGG